MSRNVMIAGLIVGFLVFPQVGQAQAPSTQPGRDRPGAAPPGTHGVPGLPPVLRPEEIEKRIPAEEREALGLDEPTWLARGKVHPDVRAILETGEMPWLRFRGYVVEPIHGTAYVAVYLRHEQQGDRTSKENQAAIKKLQSRVLSRLTAAEFSTFYAFKNRAALLGFVSKDGLTKLENDADVIAIGLDDKPLPEDAPRARRRSWEHQGG
ncbi:MAG: hypothetical protein ABII12_09440, partial [Planctomycetota bacterium]